MTARPRTGAAALVVVLVTLLIDILGVGLVVPVLPALVVELSGGASDGARALGALAAVYAAMQFVCAPALGALSDRFGRRPVLLAALFGLAVDYALLSFAPTLAWLIAGRVIAGVLGSSVTVVNAFVADVTPPEERARAFGWIGAAFGLGIVLGPLLGGLLGSIGLRVPFMVASALATINLLAGLFLLPESLLRERRLAAFSWRRLSPFAALRVLGRRGARGICATFVLSALGNQMSFSTFVLFTQEVLGWTPRHNGAALTAVGVLTLFVQAGLVGPAVRAFGERRVALAGLLLGTAQFLLMGAAGSAGVFLAGVALGCLGGVANPALQGLASRAVDESEQGALQGGLTGVQSLAGVLGPLIATNIFAWFTEGAAPVRLPGAAFLVGGVCLLLGAALVRFAARPASP